MYVCRITAKALFLKGDATYPEAAVVYNVLQAAHTGHLYRSIAQPPYTPAPYGPLFYGALAVVARVAQLGMDSVTRVGRLLSLACFLATAGLAFRCSKLLGLPVAVALCSAAFVLADMTAAPWNATVRPDLLGILLALASVYLLTDEAGRRRFVLASLCLAAAIIVKQSLIAAPSAAILYLLLGRRYRRAVAMAAMISGLAAATVLALHFRGDAVIANLFMLRHSAMEIGGAWHMLYSQVLAPNPHTPLLMCAVVGCWVLFRDCHSQSSLLLLYFGAAWITSLLQLLHIGSNVNTLLEAWVVSAVLAAVGIQQMLKVRPALVAVTGAIVIACVIVPDAGLRRSRDDIYRQLHDTSKIADFAHGRRVLTDVPYVGARSMEPVMLDSYFSTLLENDGIWHSTPITHDIRTQQFDAVLITYHNRYIKRYRDVPFFSSDVVLTLFANYRPECEFTLVPGFSRVVVWLPANRATSGDTQVSLRSAGCGPRTIYKAPGT